MLTNEHDINIYAPDNETVKLIAYQWVTYPADERDLLIRPEVKYTAGRGDEVEPQLTLTVKDNLPVIAYLFSILEDTESLTKMLDDSTDWELEEYDAWHGVWDDFVGDNAPSIVKEWAQSLPEYDDGMPESEKQVA